jgi:hypothetical protein
MFRKIKIPHQHTYDCTSVQYVCIYFLIIELQYICSYCTVYMGYVTKIKQKQSRKLYTPKYILKSWYSGPKPTKCFRTYCKYKIRVLIFRIWNRIWLYSLEIQFIDYPAKLLCPKLQVFFYFSSSGSYVHGTTFDKLINLIKFSGVRFFRVFHIIEKNLITPCLLHNPRVWLPVCRAPQNYWIHRWVGWFNCVRSVTCTGRKNFYLK